MIKLRNTTNEEIILMEILIRETGQEDNVYEIPSLSVPQWADNDEVLQAISDGSVILSLNDTEISSVSKAIDILKNIAPKEVNSTHLPFSSKILLNGKKLFVRNYGQQSNMSPGVNIVDFVVPYSHCKINEIEILNAESGDVANLKILDSETGTYTTVPYYQLNQFAFNLNISKDCYRKKSEYDSDLYGGMIIRIEYNSVSAKAVYFNYMLHEIKD